MNIKSRPLRSSVVVAVATLFATVSVVRAESVNDAFKRGIQAEELNRDLKAAADAYAEAVHLSVDQRSIEATALFRLAECQRRLGQTNEAVASAQRLVREYPEQKELLAKLGKVGGAKIRATSPRLVEMRKELESFSAAMNRKIEEGDELQVKHAKLKEYSGVRFAARVPAEYSTPELQRLVGEKNGLEIRRVALTDFGPEHPEVLRVNLQLKTLDSQFDEQREAIFDRMWGDANKRGQEANALKSSMQSLQKSIDEEEKSLAESGATSVSMPGAETQPAGELKSATKTIPPESVDGADLNATRSVDNLTSEIDGLTAELGVLDQLTDVVDKARFLLARHRDVIRSDVSNQIAYFDQPAAAAVENAPEAQRKRNAMTGLVEYHVARLRDRLHFAQMEADILRKQKAERDPVRIVVYGEVNGIVELKYGEKLTVSEAILRFPRSESANLRRVLVHRLKSEKTNAWISVNVDQILRSNDRNGDLELQRGDRIEVRSMGRF